MRGENEIKKDENESEDGVVGHSKVQALESRKICQKFWVGLNTEKDRKGPKRTEKDRKGPKRTEKDQKGTEKDRKGTEKDRKGRTSLLFTEKEAKSRR